ncbi:hypothetical protein BDR04DRAFT_1129544 [Suillus decipiens]|nr:hypothetical protein BDR04DRAFT_1129544 [Suillus decipiens]
MMPIKVDRFEEFLVCHPNQHFVKSICQALYQGFWPWANTSDDMYPTINDNSHHTCAKNDEQLHFGTDLLPGMYSVPMHTLHLVVDHTVGNYSLNSMINCDSIKGMKLDGRGSPKVWISFMSLVAWIAIHHILIDALKTYMDDSFSFLVAGCILYYAPYDGYSPVKQTHLLQFWDQVSGAPLTVIGFDVNSNAMQKDESVVELCFLYDMIRGKSNSFTQIHVNNTLINELLWIADHIEHLDGLHLFKCLDFDPLSDDIIVAYTDASGVGSGLCFPDDNFACQCHLPSDAPHNTIFFFEALAVCSAIHTIVNMHEPPGKLPVYTDNTNTVAMFDFLHAKPAYNSLLLLAVDVLFSYNVDLWVEHIPGHQNVITNALSCFHNELVKDLVPAAQIFDFEPPWDVLGAIKIITGVRDPKGFGLSSCTVPLS